jgi:hypothetical protein
MASFGIPVAMSIASPAIGRVGNGGRPEPYDHRPKLPFHLQRRWNFAQFPLIRELLGLSQTTSKASRVDHRVARRRRGPSAGT